ncbi:hypothetical protein EX30DRAFT_371394 [Ascodesmis nigricans]|uniref:Killer toxin Kp4 domain-containing protein n=1 Tax=Ascodesmis nigricans TaxID=341454 RepID=A0A4S2MXR4_9PEZI|nr:hypothetical protein EX30DRAFT_371394 [Ascodesmis nigricans]
MQLHLTTTNLHLLLLLASTANAIPFTSLLPRAINLSSLNLPNITPNVTITGTDPFSALSSNQTAAVAALKQANTNATTSSDFCRALSTAQASASAQNPGAGKSIDAGSAQSTLSFLSSLFQKRSNMADPDPNYNKNDNVNIVSDCGGCGGRNGGSNSRSRTFSAGCGRNCNRNRNDNVIAKEVEGGAEKRRRAVGGAVGEESENWNVNPAGETWSESVPSAYGGGETNMNVNTPCSCSGAGTLEEGSYGGSYGSRYGGYGGVSSADAHEIAAGAIDEALTNIGSGGCICKRDNIYGDLNLNIFNAIVTTYGDANGTVFNGTNGYQINGVIVPDELRNYQPTTLKNACQVFLQEEQTGGGNTTTGGGNATTTGGPQNNTQTALDTDMNAAMEEEQEEEQGLTRRFLEWVKN